ncbi:MAG: hypothetical protein U1E49_12590 [Hyphomicrobiaceae bacterium]
MAWTDWFSTSLVSLAMLLGVASAAPARADEPNLTMHRATVSADDGTGWHKAVSTKGAFEVLLPAPFNDFTVAGTDGNVGDYAIHTLGTETPDGLKLSVTEMPYTPKMTHATLDEMLKTWTEDQFQKVSDLERAKTGDEERVSLTVVDTVDNAAFIQYVRTPKALYTFVIEFRNWRRDEIKPIRDKMFASFRIRPAP